MWLRVFTVPLVMCPRLHGLLSAGNAIGSGSKHAQAQISYAHQVERGCCEGEHPTDAIATSMTGLAKICNGLDPTKDFFDPLASALTCDVSVVTDRATIDRAELVPTGHMRRDPQVPKGRRERGDVRNPCHHPASLVALWESAPPYPERLHARRSRRAGQTNVGNEPVPVFHQHCPPNESRASWPRLFRYNRASGSVVEA